MFFLLHCKTSSTIPKKPICHQNIIHNLQNQSKQPLFLQNKTQASLLSTSINNKNQRKVEKEGIKWGISLTRKGEKERKQN